MKFCTCFITISLALSACGGGGGGGGSKPQAAGPASLNVIVTPEKIDSGDQAHVEVELSEILRDAIQLKVRFPAQLSYVLESSFMEANNQILDLRPRRRAEDGTNAYVIYRLNMAEIASELETDKVMRLIVHFDIEGKENISEGIVSADADLDDGDGFDLENPLFDEIAQADIIVGPTPTPTPSSE